MDTITTLQSSNWTVTSLDIRVTGFDFNPAFNIPSVYCSLSKFHVNGTSRIPTFVHRVTLKVICNGFSLN